MDPLTILTSVSSGHLALFALYVGVLFLLLVVGGAKPDSLWGVVCIMVLPPVVTGSLLLVVVQRWVLTDNPLVLIGLWSAYPISMGLAISACCYVSRLRGMVLASIQLAILITTHRFFLGQ